MDSTPYAAFLTAVASLSLAILGYVGALEIHKASARQLDDNRLLRSIFFICLGCVLFSLLPLISVKGIWLTYEFRSLCLAGLAFSLLSIASSIRRTIAVAHPIIYWPLLLATVVFTLAAMLLGFYNPTLEIYCSILIWYFIILLLRAWFFVTYLVERQLV